MRNAFAKEKITYIEDTGQVLYRSDMTHGKNKKNFELLPAEEFIATKKRTAWISPYWTYLITILRMCRQKHGGSLSKRFGRLIL
jgi:hypothetical protein